MLLAILQHGLSAKWVHTNCACASPNPTTYPEALLACLIEGGEVVFVG